MPRGFTDSIQKAKHSFENLKKESLIKGRNLATFSNISKKSKTSRNNFYTQKNQEWEKLVEEIDQFAIEFNSLTKGKYKNPEVEAYKKEAKEWHKKYIAMTKQNYELLKEINNLNQIIKDKQQTINHLQSLK